MFFEIQCESIFCDDFSSSFRGTSKIMALTTLVFIVVIFAVLYFLVITKDSKYNLKKKMKTKMHVIRMRTDCVLTVFLGLQYSGGGGGGGGSAF